VLGLLAFALACVAGLWLLVWIFQARLVWYPGPPPTDTPADLGLAYDELFPVTRDGVRLHAWLVHPLEREDGAPARGAVLFSHGNAGNLGGGRLGSARALAEAGWATLLYDYRGYGKSAGTPSEEGTYLDAEAAWQALVDAGFAPTRIVSYGESLGAAVALELALRRPVAGVVLESAFTSIPAIGARYYPWLPVRLLARIHYDNLAKIGRLEVPVLVIHSPGDEIVPFEHGRELFEAARSRKAFLETDGRHNDGGSIRTAGYREVVRAFLESAVVE
jgi:hypothetical protein